MRFEAWPVVWLLALLPVLALLYAYGFRRRRAALAAFVEQGMALLLPAGRPRSRWASALCLLGATACLVVALMQPHWGRGSQSLPLLGRDMIVVLDISYSMLAEDARPNRLERAKAAIRTLVDAVQREGGHRLGLLAFAGGAEVLCPLTRDYALFLKRLGDASVDATTQPGTSIPTALQAAMHSFGELTPGYTDLILVSDGGNHGGEPAEAAAMLARQGLRLAAVGVGEPDRSTSIPVNEGDRRAYLSRDGQEVRTRLQSHLLATIAAAGGGAYLALEDGSGGLERLYREQIAGAPRRALISTASPELGDRYQVFVVLAMVLLLLELALARSARAPASDGWSRRAWFGLQPRPRMLAGMLALLPILGSDEAVRAVREGNQLYGSGQYQAALDRYGTAAAALPESATIRFNQGAALFKNRDQDQALDRFLAALATAEPALAGRAKYNIGVIKYRQALAALHDHSDALPLTHAAVRSFRESLAVDPSRAEARYNLELAYRLQHRLEQQAVRTRQNANQPYHGTFFRRGQAFADLIRNQGHSRRQASPDRSHRARNDDPNQKPGAFASDQDAQPVAENAPLPPAMDPELARRLMAELRQRFAAAEIRRQEERREQLLETREPMPW